MVNLIICGALGQMGIRICNLAKTDPEFKLVGLVEQPQHPDLGKEVLGTGCNLATDLNEVLTNNNIIIEFTTPESTINHLHQLKNITQKKEIISLGIVIGTTGFSPDQKKEIETCGTIMPIILSPNMSVGINLLFNLIAQVTKSLPGYDIEIVELHHNRKKDAPSGTAAQFAELIATAREWNLVNSAVYGRNGTVGVRKETELGILSVRGGDIVGDHTIIFAGPGERIEFTHRAHSRDTFAAGALRAAKWLYGKPAGMYTMANVLK